MWRHQHGFKRTAALRAGIPGWLLTLSQMPPSRTTCPWAPQSPALSAQQTRMRRTRHRARTRLSLPQGCDRSSYAAVYGRQQLFAVGAAGELRSGHAACEHPAAGEHARPGWRRCLQNDVSLRAGCGRRAHLWRYLVYRARTSRRVRGWIDGCRYACHTAACVLAA